MVYDYLTKSLARLSLLLCFSKVLSNVVFASYLIIFGSSGFWSDKFCHLCLEFEAMSHGDTERTEDY